MTAREAWRNSIQPRIEDSRARLRQAQLETLAHCSGATLQSEALHLQLLRRDLLVEASSFVVAADGAPCAEETQMLVLDYLLRCGEKGDRSKRGAQWIGFSELPDGAFYAKAFHTYTTDLLVRETGGDGRWLRDAAERLGAESIDMGDIGVSFQALPAIKLAIVWWSGDDEFDATANLLFDPDRLDVLPIDGYAALGRLLCRELLSIAQTDGLSGFGTAAAGGGEGDPPSLDNVKEEPCQKS